MIGQKIKHEYFQRRERPSWVVVEERDNLSRLIVCLRQTILVEEVTSGICLNDGKRELVKIGNEGTFKRKKNQLYITLNFWNYPVRFVISFFCS